MQHLRISSYMFFNGVNALQKPKSGMFRKNSVLLKTCALIYRISLGNRVRNITVSAVGCVVRPVGWP